MGASSSSWESSYLNSTSGLLSLLDLNPNYLNQVFLLSLSSFIFCQFLSYFFLKFFFYSLLSHILFLIIFLFVELGNFFITPCLYFIFLLKIGDSFLFFNFIYIFIYLFCCCRMYLPSPS